MAAVVPTPAAEPVAQASVPGVATPAPAPLGGTDAGLDVLPANDVEFFALGQMEVTPKMIDAFQSGSGVAGPYGYIIDLGEGG